MSSIEKENEHKERKPTQNCIRKIKRLQISCTIKSICIHYQLNCVLGEERDIRDEIDILKYVRAKSVHLSDFAII
jgi:hypothetical protein